jgi:serine/threonine protein kinase
MPNVSIASFVDILSTRHLLEPRQLAEASGLGARLTESKALAGELIRRGWLTPFQVNQIFQGRHLELTLGSYVLLERLGEGGMGQVFKARNWKMNRTVALKVVRKERLGDAEAVRRFQREIRAAAQLSHPNIVHAYDAAEEGDRIFYVMEYVDGIDLARLVRRDGPLPVDEARDCIRQAALGLQHAFERGLVHRDIKPHNLLRARTTDGRTLVKILDMGLARLDRGGDGLDSDPMTREGVVMGTLDYLAPEQARNAHLADTRSDLYGLGCTLYFLLAGQPPFAGGSPTEKLIKHQMDSPPPVEQLRAEVPAWLSAVVERLMAKKPEHRYQTPAETAEALIDACRAPVAALKPPASPMAATLPEVQIMSDTSTNWSSIVEEPAAKKVGSSSRRRRGKGQQSLLWFGGLAGFILLTVLALLLIFL